MDILFLVFAWVVLAGYLLTEGAVIGAGMHVFTFDHRRVGTAIGPLFLGTEVWFVALIGLFAGAFPPIEASMLATAYPIIALFLFCWVARDAALWFGPRIISRSWQGFWATILGGASIVMGICLGGTLGMALAGGGSAGHHATFDPTNFGAPQVWLGAIIVPVILAWHGRSFLRYRERISSSGNGWVSSITTLVVASVVVAVGAETLMDSVVGGQSAVVLAAIAVPVFAFMLVVQALWWWLAVKQSTPATDFFRWRTHEPAVPASDPVAP